MAKSIKILWSTCIAAASGLVILADLVPPSSFSNSFPLFLGVKEQLIVLPMAAKPALGRVLAYTEGGVPGWLESLL